ncbi:MAG: IS3 family transposase [Chloroflexi bacterium]|nr:IS3 family transposase [Chloroflexota bacterium]
MQAVQDASNAIDLKSACEALFVPRANFYRWQKKRHNPKSPPARPNPPLALGKNERQRVLDVLHSDRFVDKAPQEVYATLLDEGVYYCSIRTMYRYLAQEGEVRERRNQTRHANYKKPEQLATKPNELWSWDITKLKGPVKWTYFYLYDIMDVYSRYVVGWMIAHRESAQLAKQLISDTLQKQNIKPHQLTIHADRGPSMKSKPVAFLMADLGVTKSHSRPYTSNDNPYSESQFKTLKYNPEFPGKFGSIQDARSFCRDFFGWYNNEHCHSGIALLPPAVVHSGQAPHAIEKRSNVLEMAFKSHPNRFKSRLPIPPQLPQAVWINKPDQKQEDGPQKNSLN